MGTHPTLIRSLWADYDLALSSGLRSLGTYNPASRLPSGAPSDHSVFPARAFDVGIPPNTGQANPKMRAFFAAMVGRPEVHYVILGDTIWSRERGVHPYTDGGHENHVHVSGYADGVVAPPSDTRAPAASAAYDAASLQALWIGAGGNPRQAPMAAAVAYQESRGNPRARALTRREDSRGLWQINVRAHPEWALRDLYNPKVNVQAAIAISRNGRNWSPWTTADAARASLAANGGQPPSVTRPGGTDSSGGGGLLGGVEDALTAPLKWGAAIVNLVKFVTDPVNWLRLVEVMFGFSLVLAGVATLVVSLTRSGSSSSSTPAPVSGLAGAAVKAAAVVK